MPTIWGVSFRYKSGSQNHLFGPTSQLNGNLTVYVFGTKHDVDNQSSALTTTRGLLHRPKMFWTLVHKPLQTGPPFLPALCEFSFYVIAMQHCRWRSANGTQPNFAKRRMV